jgi:hypothetical protein
MNRLIQLNKTNSLILIVLSLIYFAVLPAPNAFGVVPAPDGSYPGGNTAEGQNALLSLNTGIYNTAVGLYSLLGVTNAALGFQAGLLATTGDGNVYIGAGDVWGCR